MPLIFKFYVFLRLKQAKMLKMSSHASMGPIIINSEQVEVSNEEEKANDTIDLTALRLAGTAHRAISPVFYVWGENAEALRSVPVASSA